MAKYEGNGIVWNPKKNKIMHDFKDGSYTTLDKHEQEILRLSGFKADFEDEYEIIEEETEEEIVEETEIEASEVDEEALRLRAKELGIASYWNKKVKTLQIEMAEKVE